jgi:hypothetical protein
MSDDKVTTQGEVRLLTNLIELARLGALLQDNPDCAKVLNQFADLMASYIPTEVRADD